MTEPRTYQPEGTRTSCTLQGVHQHAFRGPHVFHEWEPGTVPLAARTPGAEGLDVERLAGPGTPPVASIGCQFNHVHRWPDCYDEAYEPDIFDRLMALWQQPWSEAAFGEAQMLVGRLRRKPLNVERLARALAAESASRDGTGLGWSTLSGSVRDLWRTAAQAIAREYAALADPQPETPA